MSEHYDKFLNYSDFYNDKGSNLNSENSIFSIYIYNTGLNICSRGPFNTFGKYFELSSFSYTNEYEYKYTCNSNNILNIIKNNEDEIFKRIFVRITDCPKWSQKALYETRQDELNRINTPSFT